MKLRKLFVAILATLMIPVAVQAADKEEESSPSNEVAITAYRGDVVAKLYVEHEVMENLVVYLSASKSRGFVEVTVGPAYYITPELQVGVSAGVAHYASADEEDKNNHRVVSGFVYYKSDTVEGEVSVSRYSRDPDPTWWQTYIQVPIGGNWSAGVYGEAAIGWGPRLSWAFHKNASVWFAPIAKELGDSGNKIVGGIAIAF